MIKEREQFSNAKLVNTVIVILVFLNLFAVPFGRITTNITIGFITTQIDVFVAVLLLITLFLYKYTQNGFIIFNKKLIIALFIYFSIGFISIVFSENVSFSLISWISHIVFVCILCLVIFPNQAKINNNSQEYSFAISFKTLSYFIFISVVTSSLILLSLNIYAYYTINDALGFPLRLSIHPSMHPVVNQIFSYGINANHIAIGTGIGLIVSLNNLSLEKSIAKNSIISIIFLIPIVVIFSSGSRSVILALIISFLIVLPSILDLAKKNLYTLKEYYKIAALTIIIFFILLVFIVPSFWIDRLLGIDGVATSNYIRFRVIYFPLYDITRSFKHFIIGFGFNITDPHNEFLSAFFDNGILGLISYVHLYLVIYRLVFKNSILNKKFIISKMLFCYIFVIISFTGITKLLWTAMIFILLPSFEYRYSKFKDVSNHSLNVSVIN